MIQRKRAASPDGDMKPADFVAMLKESPEFSEQIKEIALGVIDDMICGVKLPSISGDRDWGSYEITGLAVTKLSKRPRLSVDVQQGVRVELHDIALEFDNFQFVIDRHSTPKVNATGTGAISCECSAFIAFEIATDERGRLKVTNVAADVHITELPMTVVECNHRIAIAAALKVFSRKGKEAVQNEIRERVQASLAVIKEKITVLTDKFSGQGGLKQSLQAKAAELSGNGGDAAEPLGSEAPPALTPAIQASAEPQLKPGIARARDS